MTASRRDDDRRRDKQYGVVSGHNTRCASYLGQGCDCRDPWQETLPAVVDPSHKSGETA